MLNYLDFDQADDGEGGASFDALAWVRQPRWAALQAEASGVLRWCGEQFGPPAPVDDGGVWDVDIQLQSAAGHALAARWDAAAQQLVAPDAAQCSAVQLAFAICGNGMFAQAFGQRFLQERAHDLGAKQW